jgi:hypothetical protein
MRTDKVYINQTPQPEPNATKLGIIGLIAAGDIQQSTLNEIRDLLIVTNFEESEELDTIVISKENMDKLDILVVGTYYRRRDGQIVHCTGSSPDGYYNVGGYSYFRNGEFILRENTNLDLTHHHVGNGRYEPIG